MSEKKGDRPRWVLHIQAQFWRVLMGIGMVLHRLARPLPPAPSFHKYIDATVSPLKGKFRLQFYVPKDYNRRKKLKGKRYPCIVNFHGGGFVLGTAHDDARWAGVAVEQVGAVVVSVDYRLAPEFPFPTAVEDGADAILYLAKHADELYLDTTRFAVSGFSSGGNMTFTVPLCLQGELLERTASGKPIPNSHAGHVPPQIKPPPNATPNGSRIKLSRFLSHEVNGNSPLRPPTANDTPNGSRIKLSRFNSHEVPNTTTNNNTLRPPTANGTPAGSRINLSRQTSRLDRIAMLRQTGASSLSLVSSRKEGSAVSIFNQGTEVKIRGIVSFYPPTDYTQTRAQRRQTCSRTDHQLPAVFTELFDDSYLQPPSLDLAHPWLSPGVAPDHMLQVLPDDIVMLTCEWDMLLAEGERFRDRLVDKFGKRVHYHCVPGVPHGWDKAPNPLRESPGAREQYVVACKELRRIFEIEEELEEVSTREEAGSPV